MKTTFVKFAALATAAVSAVSAVGAIAPVNAAAFGQREVTQDKFAVVAAPRGTTGTAHQLLILEQVSDARACWSESGNRPTTIDPLLLTFNFTGICGRSTDSNGYSIRMAGQDLGMSYSLRMVHRNNDIVLVGVNDRDRSAPQVEIGRAGGITNGFAKINLNSGWRLTKRTYDEKATGHVYVTNDLTLAQVTGSQPSTPTPTTPSPNPGSNPTTPTTPLPPVTPPVNQPLAFRDIANDIYRAEIEEAVKTGFVAGFQDDTFRPNGTLTREQLVSMVIEALAKQPNSKVVLPAQAVTKPYGDVEMSRWSAAKIQFAKANKIVSGYGDGSFRPAQAVTRAEMMAVMRRAAEFSRTSQGISPQAPAVQANKSLFSDTKGHWASSLIEEMGSYCEVASPFNEKGTAFFPDTPAQRNYAAAATLRTMKCAQK